MRIFTPIAAGVAILLSAKPDIHDIRASQAPRRVTGSDMSHY